MPCSLHHLHIVPEDKLRGLVFDCDGTLADSMPVHFEAWTTVLNRYGVKFPESQFYAMGGVPSTPIVQTLLREQGVALPPGVTVQMVVQEKQAEFERLEKTRPVKGVDHVVAIARKYHETGLPMAVASGGEKANVMNALRQLGIQDWFKAVVACEDVHRSKPDPECYLLAASRLGVDPVFIRAFEDTDIGLQAIRGAGMQAIDIRTLPR